MTCFEKAGGGGPNGGMGLTGRGRSWVDKAAPLGARGTQHVEDIDVLAHVVAGVRDKLRIDPKAKRDILAKPDGHLAILLLESHESARRRANGHPFTPLTAYYIRCLAERIGHPIGRDRAYRVNRTLREAGILTKAGICVPRCALKPLIRLFEIPARFKRWKNTSADARVQSPVPDRKPVKARKRNPQWWETTLGGEMRGPPAPAGGFTRRGWHAITRWRERYEESYA
jgi:hypothetical protein